MNSIKKTICGLLGIGFLAMVAGCGAVQPPKAVSVMAPDFFGIGEELAQQLIANRRSDFGLSERLVFTTLVNLDDLRQTSKFGRAMSESLATRLFQHGYGVVELRKIENILVADKSGELVLSRETKRLAAEHEADAIVAGTYSMTPGTVIINVKVLDVGSQEVLSVGGLELQRSYTINYLLADRGGMVDSKLSGYER
jgi:TolB-like protein